MENSLYIAAMNGDTGFLREARDKEIESGYWDQYLSSKTPETCNNILHVAALHGRVGFIENVLNLKLTNSAPIIDNLINEKNDEGDTPLHIASKKGNLGIVQLLTGFCSKSNPGGPVTMLDHLGEIEVAEGDGDEGWRVQNKEGNTALHEALINGKIEVARYLLVRDDHLTTIVNNHKETPLHLAIKHNIKDDKKLVIKTIELMNKQNASLTCKSSKCSTKEESSTMIQLLITKSNVEVLYMCDENGLTPLLRAATVCHVPAIRAIITKCPHTIETCDFDGQTMLHLLKTESYDDAKTLMDIPSVNCLKDQRDHFGNTPAIVAVRDIIDKSNSQVNFESGLFKALLASSANFTLKNKMGISAVALIEQHENIFSHIWKDKSNEETKATTQEHEICEIRKAIKSANLENLRQKIDYLGNDLSYYDCLGDGGNILHGVLKAWKTHNNNNDKSQLFDFINEILDKFPCLLCQVDLKGDTPLHIIVRDNKEITTSFLEQIMKHFKRYQQELSTSCDEEVYYCSPWRIKNVQGNTPFHEALLHSPDSVRVTITSFLKEQDTSVFSLKNYQNETPLHVLCGHTDGQASVEVTREVVGEYKDATYIRDVNGLTPLLKAAQSGNIIQAQVICELCPESAQLKGDKGKTFWHVIDLSNVSRDVEKKTMHWFLFENEEIKQMLHVKDDDGNTPVKLAMVEHNFHILKALKPCDAVFGEVRELLNNSDLETRVFLIPIIRMIGYFPQAMEKTVWETLKKVPNESFFGVSESEITNYTQTLGLIATLLATIAFTAAFSVPGGFRQNHEYLNQNHTSVPLTITPSGQPDPRNATEDVIGTPVLLGTDLTPILISLAYWVFMVSDILTICFSIFVIYCQLWIMKNTEMRMVFIDISIFSLQICFFTVMITFMMGVFATTLQVEPSLSYITLVVCSVLMMLMNRCLYPIKSIFLWYGVFYKIFIQAFGKL